MISYNINNVTKKLENELTIVVYLDRETSNEDAFALEPVLKKINNVSDVTFKGKDEWKFEMQNYSESLNTTLSYLKENPLLDSYIVKVKNVKQLKKTSEEIKKIESVRSAEYGEGMVEQLIKVFDLVKKITLFIVAAIVLSTAFLINNARSGLVDMDALYDALVSGKLAWAAADVFDPEPIPEDHKILTLPNITLTPHMASATVETRDAMAMLTVDNILAALKGEDLLTEVKAK